jgi:septal ring factor EnvC (AmiA/AmiB activator)
MSMMFGAAAAQNTIEELREQIRRDQQQLEATNALLGKNRDNIRLSERDLKLVRNNIATRQNMVLNLDREVAIISAEIIANTRQVRQLDAQLETLKKEYGEMVYSAWKNHKLNNALAFLFASHDFNDATRRISYMKRYNAMREKRGAEIDSLDYLLQYELEKLNVRKTELDHSKQQRTNELASLDQDEKQQSTALAGLRADQKKLETKAKEQQRKIAAAQKNIDRIIAEQAKAGKTGRSQEQIEADVILSGKFEDNKGRLPWPAGGPGSVLDRFGRHAVSSQKEITNDFKGINIAAPRGAQVRAVFEGEVTGVYNIDLFNNCVTVRSGSYIVLYANLAATNVKMGDRVAINQQVGSLFDTDDENQHMLIFQIWRETTALNPEQWLRK